MKTGTIVLLVILAVLIGVLVALYFFGKRLQKKQDEQNERIQAYKQPVVMLVIDKKKLKLKESGLPDEVISQTPWYARRSKVPIVKVKVGNKIMNLIADVYIVEVKGMRGQKLVADTNVKKSWFRRQMDKLQEKAGAKPVK